MSFNDLYVRTSSSLSLLATHGNEEYTPKQGSSESCFHDLFVAFGGSEVSPQQRRDVECHLGDGSERCVHHRSQGKVTLCRDAVAMMAIKQTLNILLNAKPEGI